MIAEPIFLTLDHVLELHRRQINRFGGAEGIRDVSLIESAIAQPQAGTGEQYLHKSLAEMAAAYLFHLVSNHGFVDGNKRVGAAAAALVFLELNGIDTDPIDEDAMGSLTLTVAAGQAEKSDVTQFFLRYI